jgi:hypothetical protein
MHQMTYLHLHEVVGPAADTGAHHDGGVAVALADEGHGLRHRTETHAEGMLETAIKCT